ncbi:MAG TPA: sodium:solute symporter family protein [Bacteroidota bacterium]|nr:sodium:solute symporter family protein [Bacteroidota bacterium]
MQTLDWLIVIVYFFMSAAIGIYYTRRAGRNTQEFFLSGRNLPWWLAGTSMVATTFAADTPLAVTELVAKNGIAGNWIWWSSAIGGMFTVFFFARLWRRAGIMTDVEFVELRYSGKPAAFLRGFRALYLGLFMNCVIMGWVNLAMATILEGMLGIQKEYVLWYVGSALVITAMYSALSGLWGVAVTDVFQFVFAMIGTIVLAFIVLDLPQIGGITGLKAQLPHWSLQFLPLIGMESAQMVGTTLSLSFAAFLAFVGVQWWASWYPGAEPGGGGYVAQRMMSAKDEKHSLFATLWFTIAHYCVRPWPWILVGLASLVLYPELSADEKRLGYVYAMRDFLPVGLRGMLVASFFAAFMSTMATQLNWGTSYAINDFYKRFVRPNSDEKHLVLVSRFTTILIMVLSMVATLFMETISGAWAFILEAGAGSGLVLIARWFWWRVNAWSEISAMVAPLAAFSWVKYSTTIQFPETLFVIVGFTTVVWVLVTLLTRPTDRDRLHDFYRRVHPGGLGWKVIAREVPEVRGDGAFGGLLISWFAGVILVYAMLFGVGKVILQEYRTGLVYIFCGLVAAFVIYRILSRRGFDTAVK